MTIEAIEIRKVALPLKEPFRASVGVFCARDVLLVRVVTSDAEGWGECVALPEPRYSAEYVDGAADLLRRFLVPALPPSVDAHGVAPALAPFRGHPMAKAALETAVLDAQLRARGDSLGRYLGAARQRVACGVSVGIMGSVPELLDAVAGYLAQGYVRIKLKIEPGWDIEPVRAVRERFGDDLMLQVDANGAYTPADARHLAGLDAFELALIEQPLAPGDLLGHARLSRRLATPICLDESIESAAQAAAAISLGAAAIVNVKPGRVGGYLEARRIHDLCQAHGVAVWCGDMLESGIGRAANLALAALPGFTLPADTCAAERYFATDVTEPLDYADGHLTVPTGPGIGAAPVKEVLDELTLASEWLGVGDRKAGRPAS
ncbi:o-succinylbenzoate synthase [Actinomadura namibiensis]|uniref:o-succinylbenzoate synthase n=1 Tax=Actinomadura namibiensis TaxID=182080 RepID=A0A7W3M026_ACTNM|nr:o-succinylbenzoate synthase [Actinomadura namibiensis]MBA8957382.1 O-succinylbenzoate synthase [Actinomadura namibiensis]